MKKTIYLFYALAAVALILLATTKSEAAVTPYEVDGSIDYFYSSLTPHGEWIEISAGYYGWRPMRMHRGWRPYLYGRWVWSDYGWYWMSHEPFGWAVYHYGRWYYDDYYGWIWIPDRVWGPAWVEWRYNDDYIGWAPLPPYASFSFSIGIRFTTRWYAPHGYWSFVRYRHFGHHNVYQYCSPPEYTRRLIGNTRVTGRYEVDRDRVINRGVDRTTVERRGRTRVESYDVTTTRNRGNGAERMVREGGRERIEVYRPDTDESRERNVRIEARRPERRISLDVDRINRGDIERQTDIRDGSGRDGSGRNDAGRDSRTRESGNTRGTEARPERGRERDNIDMPASRQQDMPQRESVQQRQQQEREQRMAPYYERREMTRERIENRGRSTPTKSEPKARPAAPPSRSRESAPPQRNSGGGNNRSSGGSRNRGR